MSTLLYYGFNTEEQRISGSGSYSSETQLNNYLHKHGIANYKIFKSQTIYRRRSYNLVSPKELSIFCKQMSVLFYSQITLMDGVLILIEQSENKQLKLALTEIYDFMDKGYTFAQSMCMYKHIFAEYLLNMVVIGETSGTLDTVFSQMSSYFDKEHKIRKKIRSAVMYPAVLTALMAAIIVLLIVKIIPMFSDILESMGSQMPSSTRFILDSVSFLAVYIPFAVLFLTAIVVALILYIRTEKGKLHFDKIKLSIPAYRYIYSRIITSRFSRSLAILLKSGVKLINALEDVCVLTDNKHLERKLITATDEIKNGDEPSDALSKINIFPSLFLKLFVIGEKTGSLDEMLEKSASVFDDEADDAIKRFADMLEPLLVIILSVIVGIILLSVMLPIITIINSIG